MEQKGVNSCHASFLQCSVQFSPNLSTSQDGSESTPQLSVRFDTHHLPSSQLLVTLTWWWLLYMCSCTDTRTVDHSSSYISVREQTPYKPSGEFCMVCWCTYMYVCSCSCCHCLCVLLFSMHVLCSCSIVIVVCILQYKMWFVCNHGNSFSTVIQAPLWNPIMFCIWPVCDVQCTFHLGYTVKISPTIV